MKAPQNHTRLTARLPEPLSERVQAEASKRYCSASDIIRLSLVYFFERECQTKQDNQPAEVVV